MDTSRNNPASGNIANKGLEAVNSAIYELDDAIQDSGNLQLSQKLNEIYDSYQSISKIMKTLERKKLSPANIF